VTLGPLRITPVTEATNARNSVAFCDRIASKRPFSQHEEVKRRYNSKLRNFRPGGSRTKLANSSFFGVRACVICALPAPSRSAKRDDPETGP
jgi:hypothetical protein